MGVKAGVKLAYKSVFPPIFTWDFLNSYNNCILKVPRPVGPGAFFVVKIIGQNVGIIRLFICHAG